MRMLQHENNVAYAARYEKYMLRRCAAADGSCALALRVAMLYGYHDVDTSGARFEKSANSYVDRAYERVTRGASRVARLIRYAMSPRHCR